MKRPAVGLVLVLAAGIWVSAQIDASPLWWAAGAGLGLLVWRVRSATWALWLAVAFAGMSSYRLAVTHSDPREIFNLLEHRDQSVALRGVIVSAPAARNGSSSFKLELSAVRRTAEWEPIRGQVVLLAHSRAPLHYGDEIECTALLQLPPPATNPGEFDWRQWLAHQNIQFTGMIGKDDLCQRLAQGRGRPVTALALRLRERMETALQLGLVNDPAVAGTLAAIMIGERTEIPPDTAAAFQQSGVFHVFAINGLHVGLVAAVVLLVLRFAHISRRWAAVPAIPLLVLYVFATGAHPGAIRALVMVSVWLLGGLLVRPVDLLSSLATAALVILIWNPLQLFDSGFLLSFAVVSALATLPDRAAWGRFFLNPDPTAPEPPGLSWLRPDPFVPRALVPVWRTKMVHGLVGLARLAGGSVVAWLGLVPLLATDFHLFTPVSIVANLLVIPLLGGVIALGLASVVSAAVWPGLAGLFNNANFFVLSGLRQGVEWLSRWPGGHWFVQAPPVWLTISYYAALVLWMSRRVPRRTKGWITGGAAAVAALILWAQHETVVEITVLNLRDGTAVFVNLPGEQNDFLVDGGGPWSGERVVVPFLRSQGVDRLESLILTHGDQAHAAGLVTVLDTLPVQRALDTGTGSRSESFGSWVAATRRHRLEIVTLRAGMDWQRAGKFRWRVLNPQVGVSSPRSADNSLVLLLEYGSTRVLLTSDIGQSVEHRLVMSNAEVRAQILIKGRHSTEPTGSAEFLDAVKPEIVVQSVRTDSSSRYLESDLRDRLRLRGIRLDRTDEAGAVTIRLKRLGYTVSTFL